MPTAPAYSVGSLQRSVPLIRIVRGHQGQETQFNQESAPVYTGDTIKSGMVMSLVYDSTKSAYAWRPGVTAGAPAYVALNDSTDSDVVAADRLIGISLETAGFVFESGWFVAGTAGDWDANAKIAGYAVGNSDAGKFKIAGSGEMVLGILRPPHRNGLLDVVDQYPEVAPDGDGKVLVARIAANHSMAVTA